VCGLSVQSGNPTHPDLCEVVITETCGCDEVLGDACACDSGPYFELVSCEVGSFPHPDSGEVPPPKCGTVAGCRGTFTRTAPGDVGSIEVKPNCDPETPPSGGCSEPCDCGCSAGVCVDCL
jgi:hypothetical protein